MCLTLPPTPPPLFSWVQVVVAAMIILIYFWYDPCLLQTEAEREYHKKVEENKKAAEERTAKKRAKRSVSMESPQLFPSVLTYKWYMALHHLLLFSTFIGNFTLPIEFLEILKTLSDPWENMFFRRLNSSFSVQWIYFYSQWFWLCCQEMY